MTLKYICEQGIACGKRHSEEAFPDSARQRLSKFRRLEQPFCGSSNHEQILPFWATYEQNIGLQHKHEKVNYFIENFIFLFIFIFFF